MLVLSRKLGEEVVLPELGVVFTVVEVKRNGVVRLGITAPKNVKVKRGELLPTSNDQPATKEAV